MTAPLAFACGGILIDSVVTAHGLVNENAMGGNAVYAAAALRLWLGPGHAGIVGHVPANYPRDLLDRLDEAGIQTGGIHHSTVLVKGPEWFFYATDGSRRDEQSSPHDAGEGSDFATFRRSHPILPKDVPIAWRGADGVHLAGNDPAATLDLAVAMQGAQVTLDPGARVHDFAVHPGFAELMARATALIPSMKELQVLAPGLAPEAGLAALQQQGARLAVVKRGSRGVLLRGRDGMAVAVPAIPVRALDPTGAGDSFCGGFLAGLILTGDPLTAACMGTVSASFAVEGFGPDTLLTTGHGPRDQRLHNLSARIGLSIPTAIQTRLP